MIRKLVNVVGEMTLYAFIAGVGTALIYAFTTLVLFNTEAMTAGLLLLGIAALVLVTAVLRITHPAPAEPEPLPPLIEESMARDRPRWRKPRPHTRVIPACTQLPMSLPRPVDESATTVVLDLAAQTVTIPSVYGGAQ